MITFRNWMVFAVWKIPFWNRSEEIVCRVILGIVFQLHPSVDQYTWKSNYTIPIFSPHSKGKNNFIVLSIEGKLLFRKSMYPYSFTFKSMSSSTERTASVSISSYGKNLLFKEFLLDLINAIGTWITGHFNVAVGLQSGSFHTIITLFR